MPAKDAEERRLTTQIAAHVSWANTDDRSARTAPARAARRMKPGDTHCIYGHEMTDENTGWSDNGPGTPKFRRCRTCNRKRNRDGRRAQPRISGFNRKEAS